MLRLAQGVGAAALTVVYALLAHHVNASGQPSALGAALAVLPVLGLGMALLRSPRRRFTGGMLIIATGLLAWQHWPQLERHASLLYWLQDVGLMLFLMLTFGHTLMAGRKPLCVHFAERMHGSIPPEHAHYARRVTAAWTAFFGAMACVSSLLYFLAPLTVWSVFVNFLTLPLVALMFVIEFALRGRLLRDVPHSRPLDALRAYLDKSARAH